MSDNYDAYPAGLKLRDELACNRMDLRGLVSRFETIMFCCT